MKQWQGIVLHHSESNDNGTALDTKDIRKWHKHQGWNDIGYHFICEKVNDKHMIIPGRSLSRNGAHAKGFNATHIGICLIGNYDLIEPTNEAYRLLNNLITTLKHVYGITDNNILGHRDTYTLLGEKVIKTCPGKKFDIKAAISLYDNY